ncbi:1-acyl-sn-glycerol-3-phosphate acyltransferase [Pedobacter sp. MR22-3]|uniref:1-acyl-sn-glycerol-3-phosphate acyltransferase n=1 Tax=Pedobacter sp. MR22-3 TaxID=2994552 RepID=UPI002246AC7E|nr:1-acyl-sn-glycerol-3-phosphate acyltransferase [Pedobacter sp. MR22-3]MCX2584617.1 1-acyl-sn-glycerol-3-phosphate acyltransferase [Pedobacter sp. MR22-3]
MNVISKENFAKATGICNVPIPGLASFLMRFLKINNFNGMIRDANSLEGEKFAKHILNVLGVSIQMSDEDLAHIPKDGAFIAIANHPYGAIESLALLSTLANHRPDTMFMGNFLLKKIPNLEKCIIAVNPFEKVQDSSSISGLKITLKVLKDGSPVAIFPAGEVSSYKFRKNQITDKEWHPVVGKIISKANVPVLPIYFHGNNGIFFSLLKLIHPSLQTAKLISELFNKNGHQLKISIGKPIKLIDIDYKNCNHSLLKYLRNSLYSLKGNK